MVSRGAWALCGLFFPGLLFPAAFANNGDNPTLGGRKISAVTALLPPKGKSGAGATLRVEAFGGCYQWYSEQPDLVVVEAPQPLEPQAQALECMERKALECMDRGAVLDGELFGAKMESRLDEAEATCQPVAILRSVAESVAGTQKVLVFARDVSAPHIELRLEVYLSNVVRLEVETRVRRINVEDVETVSAKAYDDTGNVFSSLEGMEFKWEVSNPSILREPPVVDTVFSLSPERRTLALQGRQSDTLLLHGISTGLTSVSTSLLNGASGAVASPAVELMVSESLVVLPSLARVPPMARLQLQLKVLRGAGRPLEQLPEVPLPAKHFAWEWLPVDGGEEVLHVPNNAGIVLAQKLGRGKVVVNDQRIVNNTADSVITVARPSKLRLTPILLGNATVSDADWEEIQLRYLGSAPGMPSGGALDWYFVQGRRYILRLEVLDTWGQAMHIPMNFFSTMECKAEGDEEIRPLQILRQTPTSALLVVSADIIGKGVISYRNVYVEADEVLKSRGYATAEWPELTLDQKFRVVAPVRLNAPFPGPLVLPPLHSYRLKLLGGSGVYEFRWLRQKPYSVATISPDGVVTASDFVGSAQLLIYDKPDSANNITLEVLVRRAGGLVLKPPQLQLQLRTPSTGEAGEQEPAPANYEVLLLGRPEALEGDQSEAPAWKALRFWNCSRLRRTPGVAGGLAGSLSVESSNVPVADVAAVADDSEEEAVCVGILVFPQSRGLFNLSASWNRGEVVPGRGERLSASVLLEVFLPLKLSPEAVNPGLLRDVALVAPCSSLRFQLQNGPGDMWVPGRPFRNLSSPLEGNHLRLKRLDDGSFEVLCLRPTTGATRLIAEVRHEPADREAHGGAVVARGNTWIWCAVPHSSHITPAQSSDLPAPQAVISTSGNSTFVGVRRGQAHPFEAQFWDKEGRLLVNASEVFRKWSMTELPEGQDWRVSPAGTVSVPTAATEGSWASLHLDATLPSVSDCTAAHGLDNTQQAIVKEALELMPTPQSDVLWLRASTDIKLRWPGYPSRHFTFAPQWAYIFEVSLGSGKSNVTVHDGLIAEALGLPDLCQGSEGNVSSANCSKPVHLELREEGAVQWPLRPITPGYTWLTFSDKGQLGSPPQALNATFYPVHRLALTLLDISSSVNSSQSQPSLIALGQEHRLLVEVWDTEGHPLPPASWKPAGLRIEASHLGLDVVQGAEEGNFAVLGKLPGAVEVQALVHSYPSTVLYSNTLYIHVFETFDIGPKDLVVLPGQTFEFTRQGGPTAGAEGVALATFQSSAPLAARVDTSTGLLTAVKPGKATVTAKLLEVATGRTLATAQAEVTVVLPDDVAIQLQQLGGPALRKEEPGQRFTLLRGSSEPLRLSAHLTSQGLPLSLPLLAAPIGALDAARTGKLGCDFRWRASDPLVSVLPLSSAGAVAIDVSTSQAEIDDVNGRAVVISVEVDCHGLVRKKWEASQEVVILDPLLLVAPAISFPSGSAGHGLLGLPPLGRVPLVFNRPREYLQVELMGAGDTATGPRLVAELVDNGSSVELSAGPEEGEALLVVQDPRNTSMLAPLLISVAVRSPRSLRVHPRPRRLPQGATTDCRLSLADGRGTPLALPPNYAVSQYASHPSVLTSELVWTQHGEPLLRLRALQEGCIAAGVEAQAPGTVRLEAGAETLALCVGKAALIGKGPVLVQPGARLHLPLESVVLGPEDSQALAFSLRLLCRPGSESVGSDQLAREIAGVLRVSRDVVRVTGTRWVPHDPSTCGCSEALEVDLEADGSQLADRAGLAELGHALWFPATTHIPGPALQRLDRSFGLRTPPRCRRCPECKSAPKSALPDSTGCWTSSSESILTIGETSVDAIARTPGHAIATFSNDGVSASTDVEVVQAAEMTLEPPKGGPFGTDNEGKSFLSNILGRGPLLVPLRFFAGSSEWPGGEPRELRSGPFWIQDFHFSCQPAEPELIDFFDFHTWSLANVSSASFVELAEVAETPLMAHAAEAAQAACLLVPKRSNAPRWAERMPPRALTLQASLALSSSWPLGRAPPRASASWPFLPRFAAMDDAGKQLASGDRCATVTPRHHVATVWVWTGGQPVEASFEKQLGGIGRGHLTVHVRNSPPHSAVPTASVSVTIAWESPTEWSGAEELTLILESRTSLQVERLRVLVQGNPLDPSLLSRGGSGSFVGRLPGLLFRGLVLVLLLWLLSYCLGLFQRQRQVPQMPLLPPGGLFGPQPLGGTGASPFRRVDLHQGRVDIH